MRICLTMPWLERDAGGVAAKGMGLVRGLRSLGHEVAAVGCGAGDEESIGLPILAAFHTTPIPRSVRPLMHALNNVDVLHVLGYRDPVGTLAASVARRRRIPYLIEAEGMYQPIVRSFRLKRVFETVVGRRLIADAALMVATSELEASELLAAGVSEARIRIRPNGIDRESLLAPAPTGIRARYLIPAKAPLVCSLGRISSKKGLPLLVEAIAAIPDTWCLIAGPDDGDGTVEKIAEVCEEFRVQDRIVVVVGGLWGTDKRAALRESDCFCLPSVSETSALATIEAAALSLPVVMSDRCGGAEWLGRDASLVVPFGDAGHLRDAIVTALNPKMRKAAKENARSIQTSLDWVALARDQVRIYESVL